MVYLKTNDKCLIKINDLKVELIIVISTYSKRTPNYPKAAKW